MVALLTWKLALFLAAVGIWALGAWIALRPLATAAARQAAREARALARRIQHLRVRRRTDHN